MTLVVDTHALVWWVSGSRKLSAGAGKTLARAVRSGPVHVSAISIFEICLLVRRGRLELTTGLSQWLGALRVLPEVVIEPLTGDIAELAASYGQNMSADPADRMIVATAAQLQAKPISADAAISEGADDAGVEVIW